jgi:hypothetical protein
MPDAGVAPSDAGMPGTDAGMPATDAGTTNPLCGGCTDPHATRVCTTACGFTGGQTCGECLAGGPCHPLAPSLETCAAADAGTDAGITPVDAGMDAGPPSMPDAGTDAGPPPMMDAGRDAGPGMADAGAGADAGRDAGTDAGSDGGMSMADAGSDAGSTMDAGRDAGMPDDAGSDSGVPPGIPSTGYTVWIDPSFDWCPVGGSLEARSWDNQDNDIPNTEDMHYGASPLTVPIGPTGHVLIGSFTNDTVYCRTGSGLYMGYYSPRLRGATNGSTCRSLGVRTFINGAEIPCFVCWDTGFAGSSDPRSTEYRRLQSRLTPDVTAHTACQSGTLTP